MLYSSSLVLFALVTSSALAAPTPAWPWTRIASTQLLQDTAAVLGRVDNNNLVGSLKLLGPDDWSLLHQVQNSKVPKLGPVGTKAQVDDLFNRINVRTVDPGSDS